MVLFFVFWIVDKSHKKTKTDTGRLTVLSDFPTVSVSSKAICSSSRCTFLKTANKYRFIFITRFINPILKQLTTVQSYSNPSSRDYFQRGINTHLVQQCGSYMHFFFIVFSRIKMYQALTHACIHSLLVGQDLSTIRNTRTLINMILQCRESLLMSPAHHLRLYRQLVALPFS